MSTTRRQFLTTIGTAAVAVPLAAALPGVVTPQVFTAAPSSPSRRYPQAVNWYVRYAQDGKIPGSHRHCDDAVRFGEYVEVGKSNRPLLVISSRFGTDPILRDFFSYDSMVFEPNTQICRYLGAIWEGDEIIRSATDRPLTKRGLKVHGYLRVEKVAWEESPNEWMNTVRYIVSWATLGDAAPSWNQASVVPRSLFPARS